MTQQVQGHILKKYTLVKKVGSGAYGHVWKVNDKKTGQVLALKKIFDAFQHSTDAQRTYREIVFLHELRHPNIIKLHNVIKAQNDKDLYLVFQYSQADLHNAIGQKILKDAHNRYILYQLVKGLKYMHSAEVIHRDLKPSNLLLNSDCLLKICDFGLARSLTTNKNQQKDIVLTEQVATRWYRAPEVLLGSNHYDKSADIWSVGCILAEILIGKPIFPGNSTLNQLQKILSFTGKPKGEDIQCLHSQVASTMINQVTVKQKPLQEWFKPTVPDEAISLVLSMLNINPKKRPTASQILRHPYLISFSKPKQQITSNRLIQPPISDNTKLNLKQYRKLIYQRIKKLYPEQRDTQTLSKISNQDFNQPKKSVDRAFEKQRTNVATVTKQKDKKMYTEGKQNYSSASKIYTKQQQQRPYSQNFYNKPMNNQNIASSTNNGYRAIKTSNSSHISGKAPENNSRYYSNTSQQQPQQKASSNSVSVPQKYQTPISSNSTSIHRNVSDEKDLKKKNSLKDILKTKKQINVQSTYNIQQNTPHSASKVPYSPPVSSQYFTGSNNSASNGKVYPNQNQSSYQSTNQPSRYQKYSVSGPTVNYQNQTTTSKYGNYSSGVSYGPTNHQNNHQNINTSQQKQQYINHVKQNYVNPTYNQVYKQNKNY